MRLEPLYTVRFHYVDAWAIEHPAETQFFGIGEGRCEGAIVGRFCGANHPRRRADGTFLPDLQGVIETDDAATVFFDYRGYGRAYPEPKREVVASATHLSADERYARLNDVVCAIVGQVQPRADDGGVDILLEVAELVWETPRA